MNTYSRIGLQLLVSIAGTELLIMTSFRLIRIETWLSPLLIDLTDVLLLCVVASYQIFHWVVKPMKILEEREKLKEEIASMARFPEENPGPVMRFSSDGTLLYANQASLCLLKLWNSKLGQKVPADIAGSVINVCDTGVSKEVEVVCGATIFLLVLACIKNARYVNVYGSDITERKQMESQLRHIQKMEAVGTLAGGIAHDFNNILNVITGYGNMVMDTLVVGSLARENMHEVLVATEKAADLTKRLLVFGRTKVVEVAPVNINELILGLQKMLVRIIRENIIFRLDLGDRQPLVVLADAGQLEQVLINLVSNAKDAMKDGGKLTISTGLEAMDDEYVAINRYGKPGWYALITVADTGEGMDVETQKRIFDPFFTTRGIGEGTGLGLAISYGIIKQHNGYIKVFSEPGQGTTFKIYLPRCEKTAPAKETTDSGLVKGGNETILVAEDDADLRKLSRIVLESFGYTVIIAEDGDDALAKFTEHRERINLVMLDMIMPKINGKEVGAAIRKVCPGMKILFASGYTMEIITNKKLLEEGFDFIQKPYQSKGLLLKVREVLDKS